MLKFLKLTIYGILILLLTISCTTTEITANKDFETVIYETPINFSNTGFKNYLKTVPSQNSPVFFAAVQRKGIREDEKVAALLNASEQASKFIAVQAISKFYSEKLNSSIKYIRDLDVIWDKELAIEMIDRLEILDISQDNQGTYLTARLSDIKMPNVPWSTHRGSDTPAWTSRIPKIPGYIVSVGIALQAGYVSDSFAAADNQALEDLARQISVEINSDKKQIENAAGTASLQTNYEISEVVIPGFYILERWRTPDARYYYSLAITPESILENYRDD